MTGPNAFTHTVALALLSVPSFAQTASAPAADVASKPVAMFSTRQTVVARPTDVAVLRQGLSLHLASMAGGVMTIVEYGVKDGKVTYTVTSGALTAKGIKAVEKAVKKLQAQL